MDTKLFVRKQPGGFFAAYDREEFPAGTVWWVRSTTGANDTGRGRNPDSPLATLDYAITQAAAGDTIFLMPNHAETGGNAAIATVNKAGLRIFGLGDGSARPTFTAGHANSRILVSAANVTIRNVRFVAGEDDVVQAILTTNAADYLMVEKCSFESPASDEKLLLGISLVAGTNHVVVRDCYFWSHADAVQSSAIKAGGACTGLTITGCIALGRWHVVAIVDLSTAGVTHALIANNFLLNTNADPSRQVSCHANGRGMIASNLCAGSKAEEVGLVGTGMTFLQNFQVDRANVSGLIKPDTTGAFT